MSRHSFRSFVLRFVALSIVIDIKVDSFAIRGAYNATESPFQDLAVEESLQLEVRHDFKRPNGIDGNVSNKSNEHLTTDNSDHIKEIKSTATPVVSQIAATTQLTESYMNKEALGTPHGIISDESSVNGASAQVPKNVKSQENFRRQSQNISKNGITNDMDHSMADSIKEIKARALLNDESATHSTSTVSYNKNVPTEEVSTKNNNTSMPSWKKYIVIDRKRVPTTDDAKVSTAKYEEMINAETRVTIKDTDSFSSIDIEKTTEDFVPSTLDTTSLDFINNIYNQNIKDAHQIEITKKSEGQPTVRPVLESVFSKRAGFLNLSPKSRQNEETNKSFVPETTTENINPTSAQQSNLESILADVLGSQSYLDEDATKDVLLKVTSLRNNEGIAAPNRERNSNNSNLAQSTMEPFNTDVTAYDTESRSQTDVANTDTILNSKSNQDKGKSTNIYTVNPNYKPMKKIDVQPPKSFVRDPDDNSWRNESISSLGIVFKPKNSSKPFTQVLKNKTETEWSNALNRDSKNGVPDLRERLEKMAQRRKTKRKKADMFGNIIYTDYEESNSSEEITNIEKQEITSTTITTEEITTSAEIPLSTSTIITTPTTEMDTTTDTITTISLTDINLSSEIDTTTTMTTSTTKTSSSSHNPNSTQEILSKTTKYQPSVTEKTKKLFNIFDYYDIPDEDEDEYLELAKLELKKFIVPHQVTNPPLSTAPPLPYQFTKPVPQYYPDRQPTIQYFPPRNTKQQAKPNRFDNEIEKKVKFSAKRPSPKHYVTITNSPDTPLGKYHSRYHEEQNTITPDHTLVPVELQTMYKPNENTRNLYQPTQQITTEQNNAYGVADHNEGYNHPTYVIKNYRDFLEQGAKDYDYDRDPGFVQYTEPPIRGVTISDLIVQEKDRVKTNTNFNYDYDAKFRKDVLQRFVDNFNHNEARYNADFPVLYNNSVMHVSMAGSGEAVASSRAFLKGLYNPSDTKLGYARREKYDPNCDKSTVELSPAYELHYYVPDQEEKEEAEPKPSSLPLR